VLKMVESSRSKRLIQQRIKKALLSDHFAVLASRSELEKLKTTIFGAEPISTPIKLLGSTHLGELALFKRVDNLRLAFGQRALSPNCLGAILLEVQGAAGIFFVEVEENADRENAIKALSERLADILAKQSH